MWIRLVFTSLNRYCVEAIKWCRTLDLVTSVEAMSLGITHLPVLESNIAIVEYVDESVRCSMICERPLVVEDILVVNGLKSWRCMKLVQDADDYGPISRGDPTGDTSTYGLRIILSQWLRAAQTTLRISNHYVISAIRQSATETVVNDQTHNPYLIETLWTPLHVR